MAENRLFIDWIMTKRWIRLLLVFLSIYLASLAVQVFNVTRRTRMLHAVSGLPKTSLVTEQPSGVGSKGVLILTNFRSGSSFFGEMFNQHSDVFYTYEPLVSVDRNNLSRALQLLQSVLSCHNHDVSEYMDFSANESNILKRCVLNNICFRTKTKDLCSSKYCVFPQTCSQCKRVDSRDVSSKCRSKKLSVTKVIRLKDLISIRTLIEDQKLDLKILHLVRDPRGIASSRRKITHYANTNMKETCSKILRNARLGLNESPTWLEGRYKLLRYEDLSISPMEMVEEVYDFVGLKMTEAVRRWITFSTKGNVKQSSDTRAAQLRLIRRKKRRRKLPMRKFEQIVLSDAYSTVRHSNATWQAWRKSLNSFDIREIQRDCAEVMELLGYNSLHFNGNSSEEEALLAQLAFFNGSTIGSLQNFEGYT